MGELGNLRDFMLIARATRGDAAFHARIRTALRLAAVTLPQIAWQADFDVGPGEHVEIFSAADASEAAKVSQIVGAAEGVRAEVAPLDRGANTGSAQADLGEQVFAREARRGARRPLRPPVSCGT